MRRHTICNMSESLSAVAKAITGTSWNGNVFWGLKRVEKSK
ncbi:MAG: DUF2924 domain-containing protein [Magnetococcales bacterium]|nr:DUF2924 domain-containing protein [Magnetococcales bacterium]